MKTIRLNQVVPQVFARQGDLKSEVWQCDVTFERGEICLVEASSGRGKSTLCSYLVGYRNDFTGDLLFDGQKSVQFKAADWLQLRRQHISCLFQELRLFPELSAWENVAVKNRLTKHLRDAQVADWFEQLGIADKRDERVGKMSFGQQQRVALVRALAQPFDFLLADEPVSHVDDENGLLMSQLLLEEVRRQGAGVIVTSIGKHMSLPYDRTLAL